MSNKPPASYAPVYAAMYPELAEIAKHHGYALAIHGSLRRDYDLIAIPWIEFPSNPGIVIQEFVETFSMNVIGDGTNKPHGRIAWTLSVDYGECAIDLSFMPRIEETSKAREK